MMSWRPHLQGLLTFAAMLGPGTAPAEEAPSAETLATLAKIANAYRIEVVVANATFPVKTRQGDIDGKRAAANGLDKYTPLLAQEFSLYPPELIKRARLQRIVLCEDLAFAGQRRNAIPDYEHNALFLDVSRGDHSQPYLCKVIHHEFFHIIDYRDDGNVYADERWAALNPPGFTYGRGGRNVQDQRQTSALSDKHPGFLNHYSTTGVEEDKAEVFANLIVEPGYMDDRIKNDPVLRAKAVRMRELLVQFCPQLNKGFWQRARKVKREER